MVRFEFLSSVYGNFRQMTNENTITKWKQQRKHVYKIPVHIVLYYKTRKSCTKVFQ